MVTKEAENSSRIRTLWKKSERGKPRSANGGDNTAKKLLAMKMKRTKNLPAAAAVATRRPVPPEVPSRNPPPKIKNLKRTTTILPAKKNRPKKIRMTKGTKRELEE